MKTLLLLVILLAGCTVFAPFAGDPLDWKGEFYCQTNDFPSKANVLAWAHFPAGKPPAYDTVGVWRGFEVRRDVKPGKRACFRWPWAASMHDLAYVMLANDLGDTLVTPTFDPKKPRSTGGPLKSQDYPR